MEILKHNEQSFDALLSPTDVFEACKQYLMKNRPEYAKGFIINPKYNLGSVMLAATAVDNIQPVKRVGLTSTVEKIH